MLPVSAQFCYLHAASSKKKKKKAKMRNLKWISVYLLIANVIFLTHRNLRPLDQKRNRKHLLLKQAFIRR